MAKQTRTDALDKVLRNPRAARQQAVGDLSAGGSPTQEAEALWTLGKASYEANQLEDARRSLERAVTLASPGAPDLGSRIRGSLTLVYMKLGLTAEAFDTLDQAEAHAAPQDLGRLVNQRGMLLADQGRLVESMAELERALALLQEANDRDAEARTLCNLGAVASNMWSLDQALRWYELADEAAEATGQDLVAAGVAFNIGYVHGLRGDLPTALEWYERARRAFASLDGVDLSLAALECDAARTYLDAGLHQDAVLSARRSCDRLVGAQSPFLEVQARLLLAEGLIECGDQLDGVRSLDDLEAALPEALTPHRRAQIESLRLRAQSSRGEIEAAMPQRALELSIELERLGWIREAERIAAHGGRLALRLDDSQAALACVERFRGNVVRPGERNPVDHALLAAVGFIGEGDRRRAFAALGRGIRAVEMTSASFVSSELRAGLAQTVTDIVQLGITLSLDARKPSAVLRWADRSLALRHGAWRPTTQSPSASLTQELRTATNRREVLRRAGQDIAGVDAEIGRLESRLRKTTLRETQGLGARVSAPMLDVGALKRALGDQVLIQFVEVDHDALAVVVDERRCRLVRLGRIDELSELVDRQTRGAQQLGRPATSKRLLDAARLQLDEASASLESALEPGLSLIRQRSCVLVPSPSLRDALWGCLPVLRSTEVTVASSASSWLRGHRSKSNGHPRVGIIVGSGLVHADSERARVSAQYRAGAVDVGGTLAEAQRLLGSSDVVHVIAHGRFRSDNPLFSSISLEDGPLTVLDIERLSGLPSIVVLGACEGSGSRSGRSGGLIGTAAALVAAGSGVVIAASVEIADEHAVPVMSDLHEALARGRSPQSAVVEARLRAIDRGVSIELAIAGALTCQGSRPFHDSSSVK